MQFRFWVMRLACVVLVLWCAGSAMAERCIVRAPCGDGSWAKGQGVLVAKDGDRGLVLSAKHVIRGVAGPARCQFASGTYEADDTGLMPNGDVCAFLLTGMADEQPTPFASQPPTGRIGTFRGLARRYAGQSRSMQGLPQLEWHQVSVDGDSGTAVYDENGEVVSILWGSNNGLSAGESYETVRHLYREMCQRHGFAIGRALTT